MKKIYVIEKVRSEIGETNSSSAHSVVLHDIEDFTTKNTLDNLKNYLLTNGLKLNFSAMTEFGWGEEIIEADLPTIINYALASINNQDVYDTLRKSFEDYFDIELKDLYNEDDFRNAYIDHESHDTGAAVREIFSNIENDPDKVLKIINATLRIENDNAVYGEDYEAIFFKNPSFKSFQIGGYALGDDNKITKDEAFDNNSVIIECLNEDDFKEKLKNLLLLIKIINTQDLTVVKLNDSEIREKISDVSKDYVFTKLRFIKKEFDDDWDYNLPVKLEDQHQKELALKAGFDLRDARDYYENTFYFSNAILYYKTQK